MIKTLNNALKIKQLNTAKDKADTMFTAAIALMYQMRQVMVDELKKTKKMLGMARKKSGSGRRDNKLMAELQALRAGQSNNERCMQQTPPESRPIPTRASRTAA